MGPAPDSIQTTKELINNIVMSASLSDFISTVEKLDTSGSNWVIFQSRFMIAISQKDVEDHFDGSSPKPVLSDNATDEAKEEFAKALKTWKKKEALALYLLTQKLPDSTFAKYMRKTSVAQMWSTLVAEYSKKSILMKANLHAEFMAMRYEKGADLRIEFDRVHMKYEMLLNVGIEITENDYQSLVLNFVPGEISGHLANVSAGFKAWTMFSTASESKAAEHILDAEALMQFAIEEWDRRAPMRKAREKSKDTSNGTALAMVSSEKPGAKTGGDDKKKRFGKRGECWNCGDKGHKRDTCPKSKNSNANAAIDEDDVDGIWVAISPEIAEFQDMYEFLVDEDDDDMPDLETVTSEGENTRAVVSFNTGHCKDEANLPRKFDDNHGPSAHAFITETSGRLWGQEVEAYVAKTGGRSDVAWDLYDSGASHHMSPCREDFIDFHDIPAKPLTAANKEVFSAVGMGDMIVSIPNGDTETRIKLT